MVARAGVFPNSNRRAYCSFITRWGMSVGQIWIDENHIAEFKSCRLHDGLHAVERQVDLCCGIIRNLAACGIGARHARNKKPVMGEHSG